jgi:hypothetical protein
VVQHAKTCLLYSSTPNELAPPRLQLAPDPLIKTAAYVRAEKHYTATPQDHGAMLKYLFDLKGYTIAYDDTTITKADEKALTQVLSASKDERKRMRKEALEAVDVNMFVPQDGVSDECDDNFRQLKIN